MPEKEITKRLTRLIKDADKLVQDIQKGTKNLIAAMVALKEMGDGKKEDKK